MYYEKGQEFIHPQSTRCKQYDKRNEGKDKQAKRGAYGDIRAKERFYVCRACVGRLERKEPTKKEQAIKKLQQQRVGELFFFWF